MLCYDSYINRLLNGGLLQSRSEMATNISGPSPHWYIWGILMECLHLVVAIRTCDSLISIKNE